MPKEEKAQLQFFEWVLYQGMRRLSFLWLLKAWKNTDGKKRLGWEIFYEEDPYLRKKITHTLCTKLSLKQKISVVEKVNEDKEMIRDLFDVIGLGG